MMGWVSPDIKLQLTKWNEKQQKELIMGYELKRSEAFQKKPFNKEKYYKAKNLS